MKGLDTIRPEGTVDWGTIGQAIDYRIRYYFAATPPEELIAWKGAMLLKRGYISPSVRPEDLQPLLTRMGVVAGTVEDFFGNLNDVLHKLRPVGRKLEREQEGVLARYCVVLASFEQVFRIGLHPRSLLIQPEPRSTVEELVSIAGDAWVEDLCSLSWAFYDRYSELLSLPFVLNPTFDGSLDVGGADADLILNGCLVDIKTTTKPKLQGNMLYQLLGYILLDYTDHYQIREAAIYFARQQNMVRWSLDNLIATLAGDDAPPLYELRERFRTMVALP